MERRIQREETQLLAVFTYAVECIDRAKREVERAREQWRIDQHKTTAELRAADEQWERGRFARAREQRRLAGVLAELNRLARELAEEEAGIAAQEGSLAIAQAAVERNRGVIAAGICRAAEEIRLLKKQTSQYVAV